MQKISKMETLISKLKYDKIKINWNKQPIAMSLFLSFLTIPVEKQKEHLGASTGWTQYRNDDHKLIIGGGIVNGIDLLNDIQYGKNLHNAYNNFITPLHLKGIITQDGIEFFKNYYNGEMLSEIMKAKSDIQQLENKIEAAKDKLMEFQNEVNSL